MRILHPENEWASRAFDGGHFHLSLQASVYDRTYPPRARALVRGVVVESATGNPFPPVSSE